MLDITELNRTLSMQAAPETSERGPRWEVISPADSFSSLRRANRQAHGDVAGNPLLQSRLFELPLRLASRAVMGRSSPPAKAWR